MQQQEQQPAPLVEAQATAPVAPLDGRGPGAPAPGQEGPGKWVVLGIVGLGVFMATLDSSIVNISLPTIARYFGVPLSGAIEWVVIAYLVATAAILLTAGR